MILALLLAAAPTSAVEAERAFAAKAQTDGQWTAFRAFAAPAGILFVPAEVNAQQWLKDRRDPPQSVMWWPAEAYLSCDGTTAVTTGPWVRNGGKAKGYFTTVWRRQADGSWKWLLDHGDVLERPRRAGDEAKTHTASCRAAPPERPDPQRGYHAGASPDRSLRWNWRVYDDGARIFWAELWDGRAYRKVVEDKVETPR